MEMTTNIAFLGIAERAAYVRDGNTNVLKWDVLGLKHVCLSPLFPLSLTGTHLGFAFRHFISAPAVTLRIVAENGKYELPNISLFGQEVVAEPESVAFRSEGPVAMLPQLGWTIFFIPLTSQFVVHEPGTYLVTAQADGAEEVIGQLQFVAVHPAPLTSDRIAAIRADPRAAKFIRINIGCNQCPSMLLAYAGLERSNKEEAEGYIWFQELPLVFECSCGNTTVDLSYIRSNLSVLLGEHVHSGASEERFVPLYERSSLEMIYNSFRYLLERDPKEERIQKFLEENPVLLHQFPSSRLFFKPPILTFFNADFAVVTPQKELVLIEIERASTRLLSKQGGQAAPLRHALDQVDSWLHVVEEHRLAVLDSLKIPREEVSSVRGVVIAGRDGGSDAEHLRRLKGRQRGQVSFMTFDDLLFGLGVLVRTVQGL